MVFKSRLPTTLITKGMVVSSNYTGNSQNTVKPIKTEQIVTLSESELWEGPV